MVDFRRIAARFANFGMALFGLAVVAIVGTGGTQVHLLGLVLKMHGLANPLQGFFFFVSLRLLLTRHGMGVEGRLVRFYARQGLAPRHTAATRSSAGISGAWLGAGAGIALAWVDLAHLVLTAPHPTPSVLEAMGAATIDSLIGAGAGGLLGALAGFLIVAVAQRGGFLPGRYVVGRWVVCVLVLLAPLLVRFAPDPAGVEETPLELIAMVAISLACGGAVFLLLPASILRARRGRWGMSVVAGAVLALAVVVVAAGVISSPVGGPAVSGGVHQNILIISITGLRADSLAAYGDGLAASPTIDRLAQRGTVFAHAIAATTGTASSAASLLTGLYPSTHGLTSGSRWNWHPEGMTSLVAAHGYRTGAFVSYRRLEGARTGLAEIFETYHDLTGLRDWLDRLAVAGHLSSRWRRPRMEVVPARETVDAFREWVIPISKAPWLAWVELAGPMRPAPETDPRPEGSPGGSLDTGSSDARSPNTGRSVIGRSVIGAGGAGVPLPPGWASAAEAAQPLDAWIAAYYREVARADDAVRELLALLSARGEQHRTLIVVVAEHGLAMGEAGSWFETGTSLPEGVIHVPLIFYVPGAAGGRVIPGPVSLVDVVPTVLGLTGLASAEQSEGEDLSRYLLETSGAPRDSNSGPVFSESVSPPGGSGPIHAVRFGTWKLARYPDGQERFYVIDEVEREIISARGQQGRVRRDLSDMLTRRLASQAGRRR